MRRLARELDVSVAAIYYHFPTKNALFFAVLSARADELERLTLPEDPRERLVTIVVYLIDTLHRLPWVLDILVTGETFGRAAMWILDEFVRAANELGASDEDAVVLYGVMWRFALGELMARRAAEKRDQAAADGRPPAHWTEAATPNSSPDSPPSSGCCHTGHGARPATTPLRRRGGCSTVCCRSGPGRAEAVRSGPPPRIAPEVAQQRIGVTGVVAAQRFREGETAQRVGQHVGDRQQSPRQLGRER